MLYNTGVGFDVSRAVLDTLGSRTPVLDRIVSYMYFSDLAVAEQSTWDDFGSGESVLGTRGDGPGPAVLLTTPLPWARNLASSGPDAGVSAAVDSARIVDLLAKIWAVSELDPSDLTAPVHLVAYRPDPIASSLRSVIESASLAAGLCLAHAPVGSRPVEVRCGIAVLGVTIQASGRKGFRGPVREVVRARLEAPGPCPLESALRALASPPGSPGRAVLGLSTATGSDFAPPTSVEADLALDDPAALPSCAVVLGRPDTVASPGPWTAAIDGLLAVTDRVRDLAAKVWAAAGLSAPPDVVQLLALDGPASSLTGTLALALPPGAAPGVDAALAAAAGEAPLRGPGAEVHVIHLAIPPGGGTAAVSGCTTGEPGAGVGGRGLGVADLGAAMSLAGRFPRVLAMGPEPEATREDPGAAARALAKAYLETLRAVLRRVRAGGPQ